MTAGDQVEILKRLDEIQVLVKDAYKAITGDATLGHRGLAERVERVELGQAQMARDRGDSNKRVHDRIDATNKRIDKIEKNWAYVVGAVLGAGLTGGGVGAAIVQFWT